MNVQVKLSYSKLYGLIIGALMDEVMCIYCAGQKGSHGTSFTDTVDDYIIRTGVRN